ncbi:hypothetical protein GCM10011574_47710 [Microbispora bryophytorum]|uniref:Uncharacterized protein n=1 Tax=Microbispora bryophytorum TaxID=1460882 RepID=A0A8H9H2V7_9ACTN|nr:hypothetical protein GCM10011574_47710 [Microbispora bryophytorum]
MFPFGTVFGTTVSGTVVRVRPGRPFDSGGGPGRPRDTRTAFVSGLTIAYPPIMRQVIFPCRGWRG